MRNGKRSSFSNLELERERYLFAKILLRIEGIAVLMPTIVLRKCCPINQHPLIAEYLAYDNANRDGSHFGEKFSRSLYAELGST